MAVRPIAYTATYTTESDGMWHFDLGLFLADPRIVRWAMPQVTIRWDYYAPWRTAWSNRRVILRDDMTCAADLRCAAAVLAFVERRIQLGENEWFSDCGPTHYLDALERAKAQEVVYDPLAYEWTTPEKATPEDWRVYAALDDQDRTGITVPAPAIDIAQRRLVDKYTRLIREADKAEYAAENAKTLESWLSRGRPVRDVTRPGPSGWSLPAREKLALPTKAEAQAETVA